MKIFTALVGAVSLLASDAAFAQEAHHDQADRQGDHHAEFASGRFHVRLSGREGAPDLVLIPGHSSSPHVFDDLAETLGDRYRVHALHVQGFAGAPVEDNAQGPVVGPVAEDLARYIAENGLGRPPVIGHSMGGTIAMMLAARHPDSVGRLMVVDMLPFTGALLVPPGSSPTVESVTPIADRLGTGLAASPRDAYVTLATTAINGMINTEARREAALADMRATDQQMAARVYRELLLTDLRPELPRIRVPTTVLYVASNQPGMTAETTDQVFRAQFANLPRAELKRIDDSAHFIMYDQPERFAAEVNAFLE
jgi:pimeloyl-ACP methyl ester carboxylesterase